MTTSSRSTGSRLNGLLGIEPGEGRSVALAAGLYFVLAIAFIFVQTTTFGLFIEEFGARNLPFAYLSIAFLASALAFLYLKLSERLQYRTLLFANLAFLAAVCAVFWVGLRSALAHWFIFLLPFWFQALLNLANLLVWPLAGRMFDVRQAKRLFGLVGAGNWVANIVVGGFVVAPILALTGAPNLYLLAAIAILAAGFLLWRIFAEGFVPASALQPQSHASHGQRAVKAPSPFRHPYNRLIFAYVLLWWISFYVIDNIFYDRAGVQFPNGPDLAAFIGHQLSVIGIIALVASTLLAGRIIRRFGLRAGLSAMPVVVSVCIVVLLVGGVLRAPIAVLFWIAAVAKTLNVALGFSISQAAGTLVYQPILGSERNRTQTIAEGIVQPVAIGTAGLLLLLFNTVLKFSAVGLSGVFLAIAAIWLWTIDRLSAHYPKVLSEALVKRSLGDSTTVAMDPAGMAQLRVGLKSVHAGAALYALSQLEELEPHAWQTSLLGALPDLLAHPAPEVRQYVLQRVLSLRFTDAVPLAHARLAHESDATVRPLILRCLAALDGLESAGDIDAALASRDVLARQAVLVGLLENGDFARVRQARALLDQQIRSADESERLLAAQVLGEAACPASVPLIEDLLTDASIDVRQAALRAAARQDEPELIGTLITACESPETAAIAEQALIAKGAAASRAVQVAFLSADPSLPGAACSLVRVLEALGGESALSVLASRLDGPTAELRLQVLRSLSNLGYRAHTRRELFSLVRHELTEAAWIVSAIHALEQSAPQKAAVLVDALRSALIDARTRVMLLLSFHTDARAMHRARRALDEAGDQPSAFAVETVDSQLPAAWKAWVLPLVESLPMGERLARWRLAGVQVAEPSIDALLTSLLSPGAEPRFSHWVLLCAIHAAGVLGFAASVQVLQPLASSRDAAISEMACWSLERLGALKQGDVQMLSVVEKVLALKSASLFGQTPDNVLADVAGRVQELTFDTDEVIFNKGDRGDSLYIIVSGKVQVWNGERMLNELADGGIFGELALLDPVPRSATIKAVEPVHVLRLDEASFRLVLAERPEVSAAIIRVLTGYLRTLLRGREELDPGIQVPA